MIVEIITTGTELLLGEITNTNVKYLAERLNANGFNVFYQTTVGDNKKRLAAVLQQALSRADLIITTGGLGPTQGGHYQRSDGGSLRATHAFQPRSNGRY